ncbi:MAG: 50S ribosomal protein L15 [Anaerolineales bacterium]
MKLHDLTPNPGSRKNRKRVGRGISAGQGKTAGRGTKGQGARAGGGTRLYHQGGNLPFFRRLPFKRGFTPPNQVQWNEVRLSFLAERFAANAVVTPETLAAVGLLHNPENPVVIIGNDAIAFPITVRVHRITAGARAQIEAAGGSVDIIE